MFQFIEFSEFSQQLNTVFTHQDLDPFRDFFRCIELAEDSYLNIDPIDSSELNNELATAIKQDINEPSLAKKISAYCTAFKNAVATKRSNRQWIEHQARKELISILQQKGITQLKKILEHYKINEDLCKKIQRLLLLSNDQSMHFESYTTSALIALSTLIDSIAMLRMHSNALKTTLLTKSKRSKLTKYSIGILYLEEIEKSLHEIKHAWCENLLDRLERASSNQDIYYSDNLFKFIEDINSHFQHEHEKIHFARQARRDLTADYFIKVQLLIRQHGSSKQIKRLESLSWNHATSGYQKIKPSKYGICAVPMTLATYLIININYLYYLCSAGYRYCYHFLDKYAHLIAQQKLLSEKPKFNMDLEHSTNCAIELAKLRQLETTINLALSQLDQDNLEESSHWFKSRNKLALIAHFQESLKQSLAILIRKKIELLAIHAEAIKIHVYFHDLHENCESQNFLRYRELTQKKSVLDLQHEILAAIEKLGTAESFSLNVIFKPINLIIQKFYAIEETEHASASILKPDTTEMESLAQNSVDSLFLMDISQLELKMKYFTAAYQELSRCSDILTLRCIEQSLYRFVISYFVFIDMHLDELDSYDHKLQIIEDHLIAANPITIGFLRDIQHRRRATHSRESNSKLQLHCRALMSAIKPELRKCSFSEAMIKTEFSTETSIISSSSAYVSNR